MTTDQKILWGSSCISDKKSAGDDESRLALKLMSRVTRRPKQRVPVTPQNGPWSNKNLVTTYFVYRVAQGNLLVVFGTLESVLVPVYSPSPLKTSIHWLSPSVHQLQSVVSLITHTLLGQCKRLFFIKVMHARLCSTSKSAH